MIKELIELLYQLAKEHKLIKSFKYDTLGRGQGIGNEYYPQIFVEEPIQIATNYNDDNTTKSVINFDILLLPQALENFDVSQPTPTQLQSIAHSIGLNFIAKIKDSYKLWLDDETNPYQPFKVVSYSFLTLRYFYDNDSVGVRCTLTLERKNPLDMCNIDEHFDPDKELPLDKLLPDIPTPDPTGCVKFDFKLPKIDYGI